MEESTFDLLLQKAAQQTTRRRALGALIGSTLLLSERDESEARNKKKGRRNQHQHRRHHHQQARHAGSNGILRDISFWVDNRARTEPLNVQYGGVDGRNVDCLNRRTVVLAAGETQRLFTGYSNGYMFLNDYYWIKFSNEAFAKPEFVVATNGDLTFIPCFRRGTIASGRIALDFHQTAQVPVDGHVFTVTRHENTSTNQIFTVKVPAGA